MKLLLKTIVATLAVALFLTSCTKEDRQVVKACKVDVSVRGILEDVYSEAESKATMPSVVRLNWADGDKVYAYDATQYLGELTVSIKEGNYLYAYLSGTLDRTPVSGTTVITLVYSKGVAEAPAITDGKISVDISSQNDSSIPFVVYGMLKYNAGQTTVSDQYVQFSFATSILKISCGGLVTDEAGKAITIDRVDIEGINTVCELTVSNTAAPTVSGGVAGVITRSGAGSFSLADSRVIFQAGAVPTASSSARKINIYQGAKISQSKFSASSLKPAVAYNMIYEMKECASMSLPFFTGSSF